MSKGVKKIGYRKGKINTKKSSQSKVFVFGGEEVSFEVKEWEKETTEADKNNGVTWLRQTENRKVLSKVHAPLGSFYYLTLPKNLCGIYAYYVEASLSGKTDKRPIGLHIIGNCEAKITKVQWSLSPNGSAIKNSINYGSIVYLDIATEGLNGYENLSVDIYNKEGDKFVTTIQSTKVVDGSAVVELKTIILQLLKSLEYFYVKIKNPVSGLYLHDDNKNEKLADSLQVSNAFVLPSFLAPTSIVPVKVGQINTNYTKYEACKYQQLEIIADGATKTIFDEKTNKVVKITYPIIGADFANHKEKVTLNLKGVKTNQCINSVKINAHTNNTIEVISKPENFIIKNKTKEKLEIETGYSYRHISGLNLLDYIWPINLPMNNLSPLKIKTATCAYSQMIDIIVYPDVKWTLDFRFGMKGPEQFTHTNLPGNIRSKKSLNGGTLSPRYENANITGSKAGRVSKFGMNKKAEGMELEFQLVLKAEYNKGEELEFAEKYAQKIKAFLNLLLKLKELLDKQTNIETINAGHKSAISGLGKLLKAPIIGSIDYPAISFGAKWKVDINDKNEAYIEGKIVARFHPLLKADVSLDIIAAVTYVPAFGQAVKAIELALKVMKVELNFLLTIFGQVNVEGEYSLAEKGGSNLNINGELGLKLVLSAKVKAKLNLVLFQVDGELSAEGYVVTSIKPKLLIGHDNEGTFLEGKCDFMGINIVVIVTAKVNKINTQYKDTYNLYERKDDFWTTGKSYIIK